MSEHEVYDLPPGAELVCTEDIKKADWRCEKENKAYPAQFYHHVWHREYMPAIDDSNDDDDDLAVARIYCVKKRP